ncbi:hypothetical protein LV457_17070 [Mycobacterium sp. MYCO198283]|uniref:hypothetical protein n=1 Tax=Mycobacterium sp. MYCO198283 TaxID=2883505 RepID=UPI001E32A154|nr:hypothetical protein [Mycobacterium sp. MYCO198283]MCG5433985.1 hypothetical protein [Mycobacterium sp. MYCO198283]
MTSGQRIGKTNFFAWLLYALLWPVGLYEFIGGGLVFGMSTDGCHDAACDARYHPQAAITTLVVGIVVVLVAVAAAMVATKGRLVLVWPFVGLLGLALVGAIAFAVSES